MYGEAVVTDIRKFMREQGIPFKEGMTFVAAWRHAGVEPGGNWKNIAQYIADGMSWNVVARTDNFWIDGNGTTSIHLKSPTGLSDTIINGQWKTFRPGNK